jgi:hypothetical protein
MYATAAAVGAALCALELDIDLDDLGCCEAILEPLGGFNIDVDACGYVLRAKPVQTGKGCGNGILA